MENLFYIFLFLLVVFIIYKNTLLSPISILSLIVFLNLVTFFMIERLNISSKFLSKNWLVTTDFSDFYEKSIFLYTIYFIPILITLFLQKKKNYKIQKKINPISITKPVKYKLTHKIFLINLIIMLIVYAIYLYHFYFLNWSIILQNNDFQLTRNPSLIGFSQNVFGSTLHNLLKLFTIIAAAISAYSITKKYYLLAILYFPFFTYGFLIMIGATSKWSTLALLVFTLIISLNIKNIIIKALLYLIPILHFMTIISIRPTHSYGLINYLENFPNLLFNGLNNLLFLFASLFNGIFVFAESLKYNELYYPLSYKLLSFSPFPSFIDGFNKLVHYEHRAASFKPFNNLAEAYHFGIEYVIIYLILLLLYLVELNKSFFSLSKAKYFIAFAPGLIAFFNMHLYPLRHTIKLLVISYILSIIFRKLEKKKKSKLRKKKSYE